MESRDPPSRRLSLAPLPAKPAGLPHLDLEIRREGRRRVKWSFRRATLTSAIVPARCPQCGVNPPGVPVVRTLQYVPQWVYLGFLLNIGVVALMYFLGRRRVKATLAMCDDCVRADKRGRSLRTLSAAGLVGFPGGLAAIGHLIAGEAGIGFGVAAGLLSAVLAMVVTFQKTAADILQCVFIDAGPDGDVHLLASPSFGPAMAGALSSAPLGALAPPGDRGIQSPPSRSSTTPATPAEDRDRDGDVFIG